MANATISKPPSRSSTPNGRRQGVLGRGLSVNIQRSMTASPTPPPPPGPSRSSTLSRSRDPAVYPVLHVGLSGKIRIIRADIVTYKADMILCPANEEMSPDWNELTESIHAAAGPNLASTMAFRYLKGLRLPPQAMADDDIENSPTSAYYGAVKHTSTKHTNTRSFEMRNCDWIVHSCVPLYSEASVLHSSNSDAFDLSEIRARNDQKYSSVFLALKRAHKVATHKRAKSFTLAIPQYQYDGGLFTPPDDALLTIAAIVDFFNHPTWGGRRYNAISHVDIVIDPTLDGLPYVSAYSYAWYEMSMNIEREQTPGPFRGFLGRRYPANTPEMPILDPNALYDIVSARNMTQVGFERRPDQVLHSEDDLDDYFEENNLLSVTPPVLKLELEDEEKYDEDGYLREKNEQKIPKKKESFSQRLLRSEPLKFQLDDGEVETDTEATQIAVKSGSAEASGRSHVPKPIHISSTTQEIFTVMTPTPTILERQLHDYRSPCPSPESARFKPSTFGQYVDRISGITQAKRPSLPRRSFTPINNPPPTIRITPASTETVPERSPSPVISDAPTPRSRDIGEDDFWESDDHDSSTAIPRLEDLDSDESSTRRTLSVELEYAPTLIGYESEEEELLPEDFEDVPVLPALIPNMPEIEFPPVSESATSVEEPNTDLPSESLEDTSIPPVLVPVILEKVSISVLEIITKIEVEAGTPSLMTSEKGSTPIPETITKVEVEVETPLRKTPDKPKDKKKISTKPARKGAMNREMASLNEGLDGEYWKDDFLRTRKRRRIHENLMGLDE